MKVAIIAVINICLFVATTIMSLIMVAVAIVFCIITMLNNFNLLTLGVDRQHMQTYSSNDILILNAINVGILITFYLFLKLTNRFLTK